MNAGDLAMMDQADATFGAEVDKHLALLSGEIARIGRPQAIANLALAFSMGEAEAYNATVLRALYVQALARLAERNA